MRYRATIEANGKTAAGIHVPPEVLEALGSHRRPPVRITIGHHSYRSTVGSVDGRAMVSMSVENRAAAGVAAGDEVDVEIELDTAPREITAPDDFSAALDADAEAKRFFDGLSYSRKQWHVLSIEGAKTPETRQRRIEKSVAMLREGKAQG